MIRAAVLALVGLAAFAGAASAQKPTDFALVAAKEIYGVAAFDPPDFALTIGSEAPFVFYGKGSNEFEQVKCERSAAFEFIALANIAGGIVVGVCSSEARRVRALAAAAQPALEALLAQLGQHGTKLDAAALAKLGWTYAKSVSANGAEEHTFSVVAVGHGLLSVPTVVLLPKGGRQAIVVQAQTSHLCENFRLKTQTPLCSNTRQALTDIARRLQARFTP